MRRRIATVVGARPQFVKAAPVTVQFARTDWASEILIHTGQHFDANMSEDLFADLRLRPADHHLGINCASANQLLGRMLEALDDLFASESPDAVIVFGDTTSTLAGALAAAQRNIPLIHVEAGLRSFDRTMPEERNRIVTDHLASLLLCPTYASVDNLGREGITSGVKHVGDVMLDTFRANLPTPDKVRSTLERLALARNSYRVATVHREASTASEATLTGIVAYLRGQAANGPVVLPLHPRTRQAIERWSISTSGITVIEPLDYSSFAALLSGAVEVFTDSGGVQKEAYFHRVPCVTLRDTTEWVETITHGWNRLWTSPLNDNCSNRAEITEYGEGDAASRIVEEVRLLLQ